MKQKTITKSQYHQLIGLKVLAQKHNQTLDEILGAVAEIVGEKDAEIGHVADMVYSNSETVDELLRKLEIKVVK